MSLPLNSVFWNVWKELGYELPHSTSHCYIFILVSSVVRVLTQYQTDDIFLVAIRNRVTMQEEDATDVAKMHKWHFPKEFAYQWVKNVICKRICLILSELPLATHSKSSKFVYKSTYMSSRQYFIKNTKIALHLSFEWLVN